jgi:hypothetical protein
MATKKELEAQNLVLITALNEAIVKLKQQSQAVNELEEVRERSFKSSRKIYKQIQHDTITDLKFPVELRKMWSGGDIQNWLIEQANQLKK